MIDKEPFDRIRLDPCTCNAPPKWKPKGRPPSRALIVARGGHVHILDHIGPDVDWELENIGADEFLSGWDEDGVFVWSGHLHGLTDYFGEHDSELVTDEARPPTPEEWRAWCSDGEQPWAESGTDYYEPEAPCPMHAEPDPATVDCGACGATLYQETGGVRDPVAGFCVACGTASIFEECDSCAPTARRFNRDVPQCLGDGATGAGCGRRGGAAGDTCPGCGGMVFDAAAQRAARDLELAMDDSDPPCCPVCDASPVTHQCHRCGWSSDGRHR